jgi:hypothetical protein
MVFAIFVVIEIFAKMKFRVFANIGKGVFVSTLVNA